MPVRGVFAEADVGGDVDGGEEGGDLFGCLDDGAGGVVGGGAAFVLGRVEGRSVNVCFMEGICVLYELRLGAWASRSPSNQLHEPAREKKKRKHKQSKARSSPSRNS